MHLFVQYVGRFRIFGSTRRASNCVGVTNSTFGWELSGEKKRNGGEEVSLPFLDD